MKKIGWIGLGTMGSRMAANLAHSGHSVTAWNRTPSSDGAKAAIAAGCVMASSIKEVARNCEILFLSVGDEHDVQEVLFGRDGAIEAMQPGALVVDTSTIPPQSAKLFSEQAAAYKCSYLDCPVSGGDVGASARSLVAMIGGAEDAVAMVNPILCDLCKVVHHCGAVGSGQVVKLCNQILCAVHMVGLCEAFSAAVSLGVEPQAVVDICSGGAGGSWALQNLGPRIISGNLEEGFNINLMRKDLRIVKDSLVQNLPGVSLADEHLKLASAIGEGYLATQGMILAYRAEND